MYNNNRDAYRQTFFDVWEKYKKSLPLQTLEAQILDIILAHPEYHPWLEKQNNLLQQEFSIEENPFFHMSLHLAIRDQIKTNRPTGINIIYKELLTKEFTPLEAEHQMMHCLAHLLWQAQQRGTNPSDAEYLQALREMVV